MKRRRSRSFRFRPYPLFTAIGVVLTLGMTVVLTLQLQLSWLGAYLSAISMTTFALYAYDKAVAGGRLLRVPEPTLHLFALGGGTPAALLAQFVLRHKTTKESFRFTFWIILILQVVLVAGLLWYLR